MEALKKKGKAKISANVDADLKKEASELFDELGLDMTTAINMFLVKSVSTGSIPFTVSKLRFNEETIAAIHESRALLANEKAESFNSAEEAFNSFLK